MFLHMFTRVAAGRRPAVNRLHVGERSGLIALTLATGNRKDWFWEVGMNQNRGLLPDKIAERVARDREEGDIAYFHALCLQIEYLTKLVTAGVVACLGDDADRHRD